MGRNGEGAMAAAVKTRPCPRHSPATLNGTFVRTRATRPWFAHAGVPDAGAYEAVAAGSRCQPTRARGNGKGGATEEMDR